MKILFHADLSHGQAAAVWRCRHALEEVGIELIHSDPSIGGSLPGSIDLLVVHSQNWHEDILTNSMPIVILERIDGAQLSAPVRKYIGHPNLRVVIKNTVYKDWQRYNREKWRGHEWACRSANMNIEGVAEEPMLPESKWITPEQYAKLRLGFSFTAYPHYDALREVSASSWPETRDVDLHFAGTVEYGPELEWLNWHRRMAVASIVTSHRPAICEDSRTMAFPEYFRTMKSARFVVSPWGLGEPCYRDFEAILSGCMVIKPDTSYIKTVPAEFYRIPQFSRCVCKPDFSDLAEVVERAEEISVGDKLHWANWLLAENSTPAIAKRLAGIFRGAVS